MEYLQNFPNDKSFLSFFSNFLQFEVFLQFGKWAIYILRKKLLQLKKFSIICIILSSAHGKSFIYFDLFVPVVLKMNAS